MNMVHNQGSGIVHGRFVWERDSSIGFSTLETLSGRYPELLPRTPNVMPMNR